MPSGLFRTTDQSVQVEYDKVSIPIPQSKQAPWKGGCRLLYAGLLAATQVYVEKVRPQFLSLRHLDRSRIFSA
jgi:hypothetical protein